MIGKYEAIRVAPKERGGLRGIEAWGLASLPDPCKPARLLWTFLQQSGWKIYVWEADPGYLDDWPGQKHKLPFPVCYYAREGDFWHASSPVWLVKSWAILDNLADVNYIIDQGTWIAVLENADQNPLLFENALEHVPWPQWQEPPTSWDNVPRPSDVTSLVLKNLLQGNRALILPGHESESIEILPDSLHDKLLEGVLQHLDSVTAGDPWFTSNRDRLTWDSELLRWVGRDDLYLPNPHPTTMKTIIIGASSGIGFELARLMITRGDQVAVLGRREDRLEALAGGNIDPSSSPIRSTHYPSAGQAHAGAAKVLPYEGRIYRHDVTDFDAIPALFQQICTDLGGLDAVIYCAGVTPSVQPDEFDFEKDKAMIDVNLLGAIAWLNQAAIRFQGVGAGTIVGIGSVAGERGRLGQPVYNTSKAALKTYLEALRNRLSRHGVKVVTIKPGPTETEMTAGLGLNNMMPARKAAELILKKMNKNGEHYLNPIHQIIFAIIRNIPSPIFRKLKL